MRRLLVPISFSVALTELVVGGTLPAIAQDATPDAGAAQFSFTPDPADCAGEPRSADDLLALWYAPDGSPVAVEVDPGTDESETEVTIPIGAPADDATVVAVTDTVGGVFACFEAGNALGAYALFTDDMAQRFGPEPGTPREGRSVSHGRLDPDLDPDEVGSGSQILGITDVMPWPTDGLGLLLSTRAREPSLTRTWYLCRKATSCLSTRSSSLALATMRATETARARAHRRRSQPSRR